MSVDGVYLTPSLSWLHSFSTEITCWAKIWHRYKPCSQPPVRAVPWATRPSHPILILPSSKCKRLGASHLRLSLLFDIPNVHHSWRRIKAHQMLFRIDPLCVFSEWGARAFAGKNVILCISPSGPDETRSRLGVDCQHGASWKDQHPHEFNPEIPFFFRGAKTNKKMHFFKASGEKSPGNATERERVKQDQSKRRVRSTGHRRLCLQPKEQFLIKLQLIQ